MFEFFYVKMFEDLLDVAPLVYGDGTGLSILFKFHS